MLRELLPLARDRNPAAQTYVGHLYSDPDTERVRERRMFRGGLAERADVDAFSAARARSARG